MSNELRIIIAGCRDFHNYNFMATKTEEILDLYYAIGFKKENIVMISGGANGVDALGKKYAEQHEFQFREFPANWNEYGKAAGPIRNTEMAKFASNQNNGVLIAFWDGKSRGTKNMISIAQKHNLRIHIIRFLDGDKY